MSDTFIETATLTQITAAVTAIGALGTAAFGLVDASKVVPWLVPSSGFGYVRGLVAQVVPSDNKGTPSVGTALTKTAITDTLHANWVNGMALGNQKNAAKTLFKLRLHAENASGFAALTGVDEAVLTSVAKKLANGDPMTPAEMDTYSRFDVLLMTLIDRAYQKADQRYRTVAKLLACLVAVLLAEGSGYFLGMLDADGRMLWRNVGMALVVGLIATPLAPIAKDLATALNTAAKAMQSVKR